MKIIIKDEIGPRCIIKEDGQKIYDRIHTPLKEGTTVTLDFGGVTQFASPFFNFAIGQLLIAASFQLGMAAPWSRFGGSPRESILPRESLSVACNSMIASPNPMVTGSKSFIVGVRLHDHYEGKTEASMEGGEPSTNQTK